MADWQNSYLEAEVRKLKQLLVDADSTARDRGDEEGLCDCLNTEGQSYQSKILKQTLERLQKEGFIPSHFLDEDGLNHRQIAVLYHIFNRDQIKERGRSRDYLTGRADRLPASEWRWLEYNDIRLGPGVETELKRALRRQRLVDPGIGSTFKALKERGFILVSHGNWDQFYSNAYDTKVQITRKGRAKIRKLFPNYKVEE